MLDLTKYENIVDGEIELSYMANPDDNGYAKPRFIFVTSGERPELDGHKFDLEMHGENYGIVKLWIREDSYWLETRFDVEKVFP